jgi:hypothetical protein
MVIKSDVVRYAIFGYIESKAPAVPGKSLLTLIL